MKFFYLSTQASDKGIYELHHRDCVRLPPVSHREYIGPYDNGKEALKKAINFNPNASLCPMCNKSLINLNTEKSKKPKMEK